MLLKVLKAFTSNKKIYQVGETIRVSDGHILIARGYARILTRAEAGVILDEYVKSAESLFAETGLPEEITQRTKTKVIEQGRLF